MAKNEIVLDRELMYIADIHVKLTRIRKKNGYTFSKKHRIVILKDEIFVNSQIANPYNVSTMTERLEKRFEKETKETFEIIKVELKKELSYVHYKQSI